MIQKVLVVDDDPLVRETVAEVLADQGLETDVAINGETALQALEKGGFDLVLSDIRMPGIGGMELLPEVRALQSDLPVILMTGYASIDSAVTAMREGAFDYITKPFRNDELVLAIERALSFRRLERENATLRRAVSNVSSYGDLIGKSPAMREIYALIQRVSSSASNVLITGESGTGKDVVARTIHFTGSRSDRPFIPVNCTAMPEGLLESELFGHVKGAFTGAHANKTGLFEEADGGTLFLDEIGDMPISLQAKMLRVLQDREVRPVGGTRTRKINVRIIAATNRDIHRDIADERFRKDLYYRLNVIPIEIPPLRERPEDIPLLAEAFLRKHSPEGTLRLSDNAQKALLQHNWEGNARELENAIERALVLAAGDKIASEDLALSRDPISVDFEVALLDEAIRSRLTLKELCDRYIERVLAETGGRKAQAAQILGVNRRTLYRRDEREAESRPEDPESEA